MNTRSRSSLVSPPITCWSVTHSVLTPRGIKYPQHKKTVGAFRPLERGSGGEHVGDCTCAGRRTLSGHVGGLSSLLPGLGGRPLGVSHPRLPPESVLRDVC